MNKAYHLSFNSHGSFGGWGPGLRGPGFESSRCRTRVSFEPIFALSHSRQTDVFHTQEIQLFLLLHPYTYTISIIYHTLLYYISTLHHYYINIIYHTLFYIYISSTIHYYTIIYHTLYYISTIH